MTSDADDFYRKRRQANHRPKDILAEMSKLDFPHLDRFRALLNVEGLSVKDAKALKEITEDYWIAGRILLEAYELSKRRAIGDSPNLEKLFD